jgi:MFS family permease
MSATTSQVAPASASAAAQGPRLALPRRVSFWLVGGILGLLMFAASAPSPLYGVYQARWHFSSTTLTAVFAVYAIALLTTLLVSGALSDHLGRRPVILGALLVNSCAMVCFLLADGVGALYVARVLQGIATGAATSALSAALIELQPQGGTPLGPLVNSSAPAIGLGTGALITSALVQYATAPTRLIYWILLGALVASMACVLAMPEPGQRRPGAMASLRPHVKIPTAARGTFLATLPCLIALWALGGLYLSLGPSIALTLVRSHNHLWGGIVIFLLMGAGAAASIALRSWKSERAMLAGSFALLVGIAITIAAIAAGWAALLLIGTTAAGFGFGLAFLGVFRTLTALAPSTDRAGLIAAIYTVSYVAFSVPVLLAGVATTQFGLRDTSLAYASGVAGLVAIALAGFAVRSPKRQAVSASPASRSVDLPPCPCTVPQFAEGRWRQYRHDGSIDDHRMLRAQAAVFGQAGSVGAGSESTRLRDDHP